MSVWGRKLLHLSYTVYFSFSLSLFPSLFLWPSHTRRLAVLPSIPGSCSLSLHFLLLLSSNAPFFLSVIHSVSLTSSTSILLFPVLLPLPPMCSKSLRLVLAQTLPTSKSLRSCGIHPAIYQPCLCLRNIYLLGNIPVFFFIFYAHVRVAHWEQNLAMDICIQLNILD